MANSQATEWGPCPCGGHFENRLVDVHMTVQGQRLTLSDIPQGVCPNCGSKVYKAEMLGRIEESMKGEPYDHGLRRSAT